MSQFIKFEEFSETSSGHGGVTSPEIPSIPELPRLHPNVRSSMFFCWSVLLFDNLVDWWGSDLAVVKFIGLHGDLMTLSGLNFGKDYMDTGGLYLIQIFEIWELGSTNIFEAWWICCCLVQLFPVSSNIIFGSKFIHKIIVTIYAKSLLDIVLGKCWLIKIIWQYG